MPSSLNQAEQNCYHIMIDPTIYSQLLTAMGEDIQRAGLIDTPTRAAKAMEFLTQGYTQTLDEVTNQALFPTDNNELILVKNIEFYSISEEHTSEL